MQASQTAAGPASTTDTRFLAAGDSVRIALTGCFLTGQGVAVDELSDEDLKDAQSRACARLDGEADASWSAPGFEGIEEGLRYSGAPYETLLPSSFLRADVTRALGDRALEDVFPPGLEPATLWTPVSLIVDFHTFGVGTVIAVFQVTARQDLDARALRVRVDRVARSAAPSFTDILLSVTRSFVDALEETAGELLHRPWIDPPSSERSQSSLLGRLFRRGPADAHPGDGRARGNDELRVTLLWLHRVYLLERDLRSDADSWNGLLPFLHERHEFAGVTYVPGTETSVLLVDRDPGLAYQEADVLKITSLQWAYNAALSEIDRALYSRLRRLRALPASSRSLETELEAVIRLQEEVRLFQARYSSLLADLGGGMIAQWDALSDVQKLPQLVKAVEDKLDALRETCTFRLNEIAAKRERRLNATVAVFTVFTVVGSVATVAAYLFGQPTKFDVIRAAWVGVVTLTVVLVAVASRQTVTRR